MKKLIVLLSVVALSLTVPTLSRAAVSDGVSLPGPGSPGGNDYEDPILHFSAKNTASSPISALLPVSVAPSTFSRFSNCTFRIVRDSDVTFTFKLASTTTNATPSNAVYLVDLSPDGTLWASNSPILISVAPPTNGAPHQTFQRTLAFTNFGANMYGRVRGLTNPMTTGQGSLMTTNLAVTTWRIKRVRQN